MKYILRVCFVILYFFGFISCGWQKDANLSRVNEQDNMTSDSSEETELDNKYRQAYNQFNADYSDQVSQVVRRIYRDSKGVLWIGSQDGISSFDGESHTYHEILNQYNEKITVKAITEDVDGNIWFGASGGIVQFDGVSFIQFDERDGLISDDVWCIEFDNLGRLWIGTINGVCYFNGKAFVPFKMPESEVDQTRGVTSPRIVHSIMKDSDGRMWFATNGGAYIYDGELLKNMSEKDGLCNNAVNSILEDDSGNIWFATHHGGVCLYDGNSFKSVTDTLNLENNEVWSLHLDDFGNIWFPIENSGLYQYDGNSLKNFSNDVELPNYGSIQDIWGDKSGMLWVGGFGGLYRFNLNDSIRDNSAFINVKKVGPWM